MAIVLSNAFRVVQRHCTCRAPALRHQYGLTKFDEDELNFEIYKCFLTGVHAAFAKFFLKELTKQLPTQQDIADYLGLRDRTSISQMQRSSKVDGKHLSTAWYFFPNILDGPLKEYAALHGFSHATSFVKSVAYNDPSIQGALSPQHLMYTLAVLSSNDWDSAIANINDLSAARRIATQLVSEWTLSGLDAQDFPVRPEQYVLMLQELRMHWADFAVISLSSIPECIPI